MNGRPRWRTKFLKGRMLKSSSTLGNCTISSKTINIGREMIKRTKKTMKGGSLQKGYLFAYDRTKWWWKEKGSWRRLKISKINSISRLWRRSIALEFCFLKNKKLSFRDSALLSTLAKRWETTGEDSFNGSKRISTKNWPIEKPFTKGFIFFSHSSKNIFFVRRSFR